jgi:hypothetical protein
MDATQDEAYEMNTTRSATNNTAVDDSYRQLASSDDIHPGVSSRSDSVGSPMVRKPTSPDPRQDERAEDHDFDNSVPYKQSARLKRGSALQGLAETYRLHALDSWFYECAALAFSVGCLVALAVMLGIYDGKKTPQLPYNITLNALISVLSTAAKSSLLFAIAGILGQMKWGWFTERRELSDMQTFDDATRGPWGALILLCSRSKRPLASLGAAITILALAYDTFLQQLVRYPFIQESVFSDEATTKKAISLSATGNLTDWDSARPAAWLDIGQLDRDPSCPSGNCTWPIFTSLGHCSKCGDTTAETSVKCSAAFDTWDAKSNETCEIYPDQGYPATVFQGIAINSTDASYSKLDSIVWVVRETSPFGSADALYEPFIASDPVPNSAYQSVAGASYSYLGVDNPKLVLGYASFEGNTRLDWNRRYPLNTSSPPVLVKAETCIITPCEKTYQLSMTAGQLRTVVLDIDYGVSEVLGWPESSDEAGTLIPLDRCWRTSSYRRESDAPLPPVESCTRADSRPKWSNPAITACNGGTSNSGSIFCSPNSPSDGARQIGLLGHEGIRVVWVDNLPTWETEDRAPKLEEFLTVGFPTSGMTTGQAIRAHNFSYLVERMTASLTKAELDNSTTLVYGNMSYGVVQVDVAWSWFILPAALNVVAIFLLLATAILSHHRKTQLWKSSSLALLYHGVDDPEPAPNLGLARVSEMERWASATSATLGSTKDGGRIVLKTLPREKSG